MGVLAVLGHDPSTLTDCSEVLPIAQTAPLKPHFPAGITLSDVEQMVRTASLAKHYLVN